MRDNRTPRPVLWLKWTVTLAAALTVAVLASAPVAVTVRQAEPAPAQQSETMPPRVADIVADGARCWSGSDSPLAPLPSATVVRIERTGRVVHTTDPVLLDLAFSEALGTDSPRVTLIALCTR